MAFRQVLNRDVANLTSRFTPADVACLTINASGLPSVTHFESARTSGRRLAQHL